MPRKPTHGTLGDHVIPPWDGRESWDEWLERIFCAPMKRWGPIHWKAATTVLGSTLDDLRSERRRSSDLRNVERKILEIATDSLQSSSSLIQKLDQQVHTLIQGKNKQGKNLAGGRSKGTKTVKDRAAERNKIIEQEIGTLLRKPETALRGNHWIANFLHERQDQLGIKKPLYKPSTILAKTKKIAARHRKEIKK